MGAVDRSRTNKTVVAVVAIAGAFEFKVDILAVGSGKKVGSCVACCSAETVFDGVAVADSDVAFDIKVGAVAKDFSAWAVDGSGTAEAVRTVTEVVSDCVVTRGPRVEVAVIKISSHAFVDVFADAVDFSVTVWTRTFEPTVSVGACGNGIAVMNIQSALVDVVTFNAITFVSTIAGAVEGAVIVGACGMKGAVVGSIFAFIIVSASLAVSSKTGVAFTVVSTEVVDADAVVAARVGLRIAFVDVHAAASVLVKVETIEAAAFEATVSVGTSAGALVAVMASIGAFVDVFADYTVSSVSLLAGAFKVANVIFALGIGAAVVGAESTFVDVFTVTETGTDVASIAMARV